MAAPTNRSSEVTIWEHLIHPQGTMSRDTARRILDLAFTQEQHDRMHELAVRNKRGELTSAEEGEMDNFCRVDAMLGILKSRARQVLKTRRRAS